VQSREIADIFARLVSLAVSALLAARLGRVVAERRDFSGVLAVWGYARHTSAWGGALVGLGTGRVLFSLVLLGEGLWWPILAIGVLGPLAAACLGGFTAILWLPRRLLASHDTGSVRTSATVLAKFGASIGLGAGALGMILGFVLTYCVWTSL